MYTRHSLLLSAMIIVDFFLDTLNSMKKVCMHVHVETPAVLLDRKRGADTPHCLSVSVAGVKYLDPQVTAGRCCKTYQTYKYS